MPFPVNAPGFGNFAMTRDGYVWDSRDDHVRKIDPETGKTIQRWPLQVGFSYDSLISADGKYWGGGGLPAWGNTVERMDLSTGQWIEQNTGAHMATAKRGGFDPYGNPWFGGGDGALVELNAKTGLIEEHVPPTRPQPAYRFLRSAAGQERRSLGRRAARPANGALESQKRTWTVYQMPEPFTYDRRTYIDSSTHPVTVWYVDYNGYLVRVQPRE